MKGRKTWQRGYAAGLIDGEGCIAVRRIAPENSHQNPCYNLQVSMNMVDGEAIDFMAGCFGGKVYAHKAYQENRQDHWRWEILNEKAMEFLKQILPFLKAKKIQAELGIRYQLEKTRFQKPVNQHNPYSIETLDRFEWYYREMRRLKKVHIPCAAVTTKRTDSQFVGSDSLVLQEKVTAS